MLNFDLRKIYIFHPVEPAPSPSDLPTGGDIYYECLDCTGIVVSVPRIKSACTCGNLAGSDGVMNIANAERVRVVRGKLK